MTDTHTTTFGTAVLEAIQEEMLRDERVFIIGEDLHARLFSFQKKVDFSSFSKERILDAPLSETGFFGAAIGAAMSGLRPIVYSATSFVWTAIDQVISQAAKARFCYGGQFSVPIVFDLTQMHDGGHGPIHSDRPWSMYMNIPGLKIAMPADVADAKGLFKTAVRDDNPVLFFSPHVLWPKEGAVPDEEYLVAFGQARVRREGNDVTLVAIGTAIGPALDAAETLKHNGISAEVIDPRTLVPLDDATIIQSVSKTGRLIVIDGAARTCGAAGEISARVCEQAFDKLKAPILRVTAPDVHAPYSPVLEAALYPNATRILEATYKVCPRR